MKMNVFQQNRFLIIGGTTKAASTALFAFLANHPEICSASFKETRFFLDADYPLPAKYRLKDGIGGYQEYFTSHDKQALFVEATPDYLYDKGAAEKIHCTLPRAKMLFILRDPIERLKSWFLFAKQIGKLSQACSFDKYIRMQQQAMKTDNPPQCLRALAQGRYSSYLRHYLDVFGEKNIKILFQEDLREFPLECMREVCEFAEINDHYFEDFQFERVNRTKVVRNQAAQRLYKKSRVFLAQYIHHRPLVRIMLRPFRKIIDHLLFASLATGAVLSEETRGMLINYYRDDVMKVASISNRLPPWSIMDA